MYVNIHLCLLHPCSHISLRLTHNYKHLQVYNYHGTCCFSTAPTGTPLNLLLLGVDATTISISWQPPLFEKQNGIIRKYVVAVTEIETSTNFTLVSYNTSTTIYSLHPYYNYQVSVSAFTIATGPSSQHITVQTAQSGKLLCSSA